ncbi:MAG: 30S ribosomal protein S6 [Armatimonadota bacterium]|nr:30S ribosomal protein S6 [Armatimonadota bacterium]MCX7778013.1 30S ribosomal protein S6 [Armatimonadota bacterium]MDW8026013.1 30S ribosomal protein S6 [Armatimonadota bacterium]
MSDQKSFESEGVEERKLRNETEEGIGEGKVERVAAEAAKASPGERQDTGAPSRRGRAAAAERLHQRAQKLKKRPKRKVRQALQLPEEESLEARLRPYELLCLVDAALSREEIDRISAAIVQKVEQSGGYAENVRVSEARRLEYPIKKRMHGIYVLINFKAPPSIVKELETMLRFNEDVLRHMLVITKQRAELE